jgi:RNA polymerase sigma-70 factor (ECF subfamily)
MSEADPPRPVPVPQSNVGPTIGGARQPTPPSKPSDNLMSPETARESTTAKLQSAEEDRAMIRRVQRGDASAFNDLIIKYEKVVFNFAYRLTQNYDDANDIAQDAFIRAYNAMPNFRGDAAFSTWIFRITTNVFLDERKRRKAHPQQSLDEYNTPGEERESLQIEDPSPTPEDIVQGNERQRLLVKAIQSLPEYQRNMVVLYHLQQKSYEEIAAIMELPLGTVKSRLNRARLALKEKLQGQTELSPN